MFFKLIQVFVPLELLVGLPHLLSLELVLCLPNLLVLEGPVVLLNNLFFVFKHLCILIFGVKAVENVLKGANKMLYTLKMVRLRLI